MFCPYDPGKIHSSSLTEKKEFLFSLYKVEHWPVSAAKAETLICIHYNWNTVIDHDGCFNWYVTSQLGQVEAGDLNHSLSQQVAKKYGLNGGVTPNILRYCLFHPSAE